MAVQRILGSVLFGMSLASPAWSFECGDQHGSDLEFDSDQEVGCSIFNAGTVTVPPNVVVRLSAADLVWSAHSIVVSGTLDGSNVVSGGPGAGLAGLPSCQHPQHGAGAGHAAMGEGPPGRGGPPSGDSTSETIEPGASGGEGGGCGVHPGGSGGRGGTALTLEASHTLTIAGHIDLRGGDGIVNGLGDGGGGSGGGLLVLAGSVHLTGSVDVGGGSHSTYGGAAGRVKAFYGRTTASSWTVQTRGPGDPGPFMIEQVDRCVDHDQDGYFACEDDCEDDDSTIHPGVSTDDECSGVDLDCDGQGGPTYDFDLDGLDYQSELGLGTDPCHEDSDGDTLSDGLEASRDCDADALPDPLDGDDDDDGIPTATEELWGADSCSPDGDGDGLPDADEFGPLSQPIDTDGDGLIDAFDDDDDGDGLLTITEGYGDQDGDGLPDYLDEDTDGDGRPDAVELQLDVDQDGIPDFRDPDTVLDTDPDGDNLPYLTELLLRLDPFDPDTDGDGLLDCEEAAITCDPGFPAAIGIHLPDTDGDGRADANDNDDDGDNVPTAWEVWSELDAQHRVIDDGRCSDGTYPDAQWNRIQQGHVWTCDGTDAEATPTHLDTDNDGVPNHHDDDDDDDGMPTRIEVDGSLDNDVDLDGIYDFLDPVVDSIDHDGDGMTQLEERQTCLEFDLDTSDCEALLNLVDADGDGVLDGLEQRADTDGDGVLDLFDDDDDGDGIPTLTEGTIDTDDDGVSDFLDLDSDDDGAPDREEGVDDDDGDGIPNYRDPFQTPGTVLPPEPSCGCQSTSPVWIPLMLVPLAFRRRSAGYP